MADNNKPEKKTEELIKKQEARQLTEEELKQVTGGVSLERHADRDFTSELQVQWQQTFADFR